MQELKKLLKYLVGYKSKLSLSLFCHILMAIFTIVSIPLIIPFFHFLFSTTPTEAIRPESIFDVIGWLQFYFVELIQKQGEQRALLITCGFLILTFFFKNLFRYLAEWYMIPVRSSLVSDLRQDLYEQYLNLNFSHTDETRRGDLLSRMTADVQEVEFSILRFIQTLFKAPILILGSIFLMFSINKQLTLFVFVLMLFTGLVIGTLSRSLKRTSRELQSTLGSLTGTVDESLDGGLLLKLFRVQDEWKNKFLASNSKFKYLFDRVTRRQELSSPLSEFLGVTVVVVLLWYGAKLVFANELAPEAFFAFVFAFYHVIEPLKSFSTAYYNIKRGSASLERIQSISSNKQVEISSATHDFSFEHHIEFKDVCFSYEGNEVLKGVSFTIDKGETIALAGNSGSGKSTIISLLVKAVKPASGQILIDGIDLKQINTDSLYKQIGVVTQSPFIFNDTLEKNLTMGRKDLPQETLIKAIDTVGLSVFLNELDEGLASILGDRGALISGGEQQRITIARALLEDPPLLLFDEPTSALDPQAERKVTKAMESALNERTAMVVAHRISTIMSADRILFLREGRIQEQGTHSELVSMKGLYNDYVNIQCIDTV